MSLRGDGRPGLEELWLWMREEARRGFWAEDCQGDAFLGTFQLEPSQSVHISGSGFYPSCGRRGRVLLAEKEEWIKYAEKCGSQRVGKNSAWRPFHAPVLVKLFWGPSSLTALFKAALPLTSLRGAQMSPPWRGLPWPHFLKQQSPTLDPLTHSIYHHFTLHRLFACLVCPLGQHVPPMRAGSLPIFFTVLPLLVSRMASASE